MFTIQKILLTNFLNTWVSAFTKVYPQYYKRNENTLQASTIGDGEFVGFGDIIIWYESAGGIDHPRNQKLAIVSVDIYREIYNYKHAQLVELLNNVDDFADKMHQRYGDWAAELFNDKNEIFDGDGDYDVSCYSWSPYIKIE